MNICEHLSATAQITPDKEALVFEGQRFSYAKLDAMAAAAAQLLSDAGVNRGDRVAIMLPNVPAFIVCYYATQRIGAIAVSLSTRLTGAEIAILIADCEAKVFIGLEETYAAVADDLPDCVQRKIIASEIGDQYDGSFLKLNQTPVRAHRPIRTGRNPAQRRRGHSVHFGDNGIRQRRNAIAHERAIQCSRVQSSVQHAAGRANPIGGSSVSLFRAKRLA